jgi:hypothetical protein
MIVAQYSVHAIAGLEPDYGIHLPNIRSPEGWQKDNVRSLWRSVTAKRPAFPERISNRLHAHSGNNLRLHGRRPFYFIPIRLRPIQIFYYFKSSPHARLIFIKKQFDNKTIVLYKRLILTEDMNPWMTAPI